MQNQSNILDENCQKMYVCGPTVYDDSHLGHARTYVTVDLINRVMNTLMNKKCILVMNITDIDDKIINKASNENTNWKEISVRYEKSFFQSMTKLNVQIPDVIIRVSEVIPDIILYVQKIIDNGFAYVTADHSVYFDSKAYEKAGYTLCKNEEEPDTNSDKRDKRDFALWKSRSGDEVGFDVKFTYEGIKYHQKCVPGWHIECSVMIEKTLGSNLDIHFGGIDLKFPHHHNERVQAHAYHHPKFLEKSWTDKFIHTGHLCITGCKMSKSLKNFTTIDTALRTVSSNEIRWLFALHKYTDPLDFSDNTVLEAKLYNETIVNLFNKVQNYPFNQLDVRFNQSENELFDFYHRMKNQIVSELYQFHFEKMAYHLAILISKINSYLSKSNPNGNLVRKIVDWIGRLLRDLGFQYDSNNNSDVKDVMNVLIKTRSSIREVTRQMNPKLKQTDPITIESTRKKLFEILDTERGIELKGIGIHLVDTADSSSWHLEEK